MSFIQSFQQKVLAILVYYYKETERSTLNRSPYFLIHCSKDISCPLLHLTKRDSSFIAQVRFPIVKFVL